MVPRRKEPDDKNVKPPKRPNSSRVRKSTADGGQCSQIGKLAKQEASRIVAQAYEEAARIVADAEQKAKHIIGQVGDRNVVTPQYLADMTKSSNITDKSYEQIDDLFIQIRHQLARAAETDSLKADELGSLVTQLEYWVESLVIDSLKVRSLEHWLQGATELARKLQAKLDQK